MTENHGYNTPQQGATDWDVPLNDNFRLMETDVEVRDTDANRSNYTPHDGAKYLATDTGAVYVGDGSNWQSLGNVVELDGDLYVRSGAPSAGLNDLWVDTSNNVLNVYDGSSWATVENPDSTSDGGGSDGGSTTAIVEDGEGDLSAYSGETGYFSTTSDAISGSGSVFGSGAEWSSERTIASTSGLGSYPAAGDTLRWQTEVRSENTQAGVLFGVQSQTKPWSGYRFVLDTGASAEVILYKVGSSGETELSQIDTPVEANTTYVTELDWNTDGSMPFTVSEQSTGTVIAEDTAPTTDTAFQSGGVGFMLSATWDKQDPVRAAYDNLELI